MTFVSARSSSAVESIAVSLIDGVVDVVFTNGGEYRYENVSRRAILNLMLNPNMSLGFWVNANCFQQRVTCYA